MTGLAPFDADRALPTIPLCQGHKWSLLRKCKQQTYKPIFFSFLFWLLNLPLVIFLVVDLNVLERTIYLLSLLDLEIVG